MKDRHDDLALRIGRWAIEFRPSEEQLRRVRVSISDFIGCVVAGVRLSELRPALSLAAPGATPVFGLAERFNVPSAALVMANAGSLMQLHDVFVPVGLHPSAPVISAAWAAYANCEPHRVNLVRTVAAGYEACHRIALACSPGQFLAGSSANGSAGAIGGAIAAALAFGYDEHGVARAVSNAALLLSATPVICMRTHGELAPLHTAHAARTAVEAALLARTGAAGRCTLEGDGEIPGLIDFLRGDCRSIEPESWDGSTLDQLAWKLSPACFGSQAPLEAALRIAPKDSRSIERVIVRVPKHLLWLIEPGTGSEHLYDRLMSLRWVVARALERRRYDWNVSLRDEPDTLVLASRIEVAYSPELDRLPKGTLGADLEMELSGQHQRIAYRRKVDLASEDGGWTGWTLRHDDPRLAQKFADLTHRCESTARRISSLLA